MPHGRAGVTVDGMNGRYLAALGAALTMCVALIPTQASGSFIVYGCGVNLCRVAPDGTGMRQITRDGTGAANYHWPSMSRDGRRMSWLRGADLMLGDANARPTTGPMERSVHFDVIRPDGARVGALVLSAVFYGLYAYIYDATGTIAMSGPEPSLPSVGWAADGSHLLLPWNSPDSSGVDICLAVKNPVAGWDCGARVASRPGAYLTDPAVSPDSRTLAVTVLNSRLSSSGHIALYSYRAHTFLRDMTSGDRDALPQWSPDGSQIVFQRGHSLYITAATASPGKEKLLVSRGETPTWGGAADPAASRLALSKNQRGTTVRARMVLRLAGSKIDARVLGTGRLADHLLGRIQIGRAGAGSRAVAIGLNNTGRTALNHKRSLTITLRISVTPPIGATTVLGGKVTLRK